jgi:hypothetical protein
MAPRLFSQSQLQVSLPPTALHRLIQQRDFLFPNDPAKGVELAAINSISSPLGIMRTGLRDSLARRTPGG